MRASFAPMAYTLVPPPGLQLSYIRPPTNTTFSRLPICSKALTPIGCLTPDTSLQTLHPLLAISVNPPVAPNDRIVSQGKPSTITPSAPYVDPTPATTFHKFLLSQDADLAWILSEEWDVDETSLFISLHTHRFMIVSNGSYEDPVSTASCVLWDGAHTRSITFTVPGLVEDQCAFRSELAGIYCQLWFILLFCKYHEVSSQHFTIRCDGESALHPVSHKSCHWNTQHCDFVSGCKAAIDCVKHRAITFSLEHVHGHQLSKDPWATLKSTQPDDLAKVVPPGMT